MDLESGLMAKTHKVFRGLDDDDYSLIRFFYEKGPASKYKALRYFSGMESLRPDKSIPRATLYRKIHDLIGNQFLKVVGHDKFERGNLKSDVEILSADTLKSEMAVLGSGINPKKVFTGPDSKHGIIRKAAAYGELLGFANNVLDSLIEFNEDLTEKKGTPDLLYLMNSALMIKRPDYMNSVMKQFGVPGDVKKVIGNINKVTKLLRKEDVEEGVKS